MVWCWRENERVENWHLFEPDGRQFARHDFRCPVLSVAVPCHHDLCFHPITQAIKYDKTRRINQAPPLHCHVGNDRSPLDIPRDNPVWSYLCTTNNDALLVHLRWSRTFEGYTDIRCAILRHTLFMSPEDFSSTLCNSSQRLVVSD